MRFQIDKENSSTSCSASQSRFRRCRRRSATIPFKWSFRCSTTPKTFCLWIWNVICVANQLSTLRWTPVFFGRVVVEVDLEFTKSILRHPSRQLVRRDGNASQYRLFSYINRQLEWLDVHHMKSSPNFMEKYLPGFVNFR
jgi:hypothetical protein